MCRCGWGMGIAGEKGNSGERGCAADQTESLLPTHSAQSSTSINSDPCHMNMYVEEKAMSQQDPFPFSNIFLLLS